MRDIKSGACEIAHASGTLKLLSKPLTGGFLLAKARKCLATARCKVRVSGHGANFLSKKKGFTDRKLSSAIAAVDYALELLEEAELKELPKVEN